MMEKKFPRVAREWAGSFKISTVEQDERGQLVHTSRKSRVIDSTGHERDWELLEKKNYGDRQHGFGISYGQDSQIIKVHAPYICDSQSKSNLSIKTLLSLLPAEHYVKVEASIDYDIEIFDLSIHSNVFIVNLYDKNSCEMLDDDLGHYFLQIIEYKLRNHSPKIERILSSWFLLVSFKIIMIFSIEF